MPDTPTVDTTQNPGETEAAERLQRRPRPAFTPIRRELSLSFEFFPPANDAAATGLQSCIDTLAPLSPTFVSVTYGAGGTTQDRTLEAVDSISRTSGLDVAAHLTCVGKSRAEVDHVIDRYGSIGVDHIVALRGDAPEGVDNGTHPQGYRDAADLVAGIRRRSNATISVAAYPEVHPKATSAAADLENLKQKLDAGADQAITQFFFEADTFLRFFERARAAGIDAPIIPGIMPINSFAGVSRFAERCGTRIPAWLTELFHGLDDAPDIQQLVAATVAAEQCLKLMEHGIRAFHFYTLNKPELTAATCRILGVHPRTAVASHAVAG